jgi:periplasmic protein TonB
MPYNGGMAAEAHGPAPQPVARPAIVAALLLHAAVIAAIYLDGAWRPVPRVPRAIPVTLVEEPPPSPPPAPAEPPPQYAESGPEQETTAPPEADKPAPESEAPPSQAAAPSASEEPPPAPASPPATQPMPEAPAMRTETATDATAPAPPLPEEKPAHVPAHAAPRKPAAEAAAPPAPPRRRVEIKLGDQTRSGDPYLNRLVELIEPQRFYPSAAALLGLQGTVVCRIILGRSGELLGAPLPITPGTSILEEAAEKAITRAAPFPPVPARYDPPLVIIISLPVYPDLPAG